MNKTNIQGIKCTAIAVAAAALLAACGGGGDDAATPPPGGGTTPPPVGSATGVLTDAAVQGVAFSTSSGVTGTTDANGQYRYNPGDTVTFTLGTLGLGAVPATAVVTPIELAAGSNDKLQNLLVLLQSLDTDGVAGNGITIPAAAAAAVTTGIDLASNPASFASASNTGLAAAQTAGGISRPVTSSEAAAAHFLGQAKALLSSQVWLGSYDNGAGILFQRFGANGEHLGAQIGPAEDGGSSGLEYGSAMATSFDARGYALAPAQEIDTNGTWGLSHLSACERVRVDGAQLLFAEAPASCVTDTTTVLPKAPNDSAGIVGVWAGGSASILATQHFVFWADGRYAMIDPVGDTENNCGGPGVEYGTYSYNASTKAFRILTVTVDTNGCAGLRDSDNGALASFELTISADGSTASATAGGEVFGLFRVSR
jgi:hypothetical protein